MLLQLELLVSTVTEQLMLVFDPLWRTTKVVSSVVGELETNTFTTSDLTVQEAGEMTTPTPAGVVRLEVS